MVALLVLAVTGVEMDEDILKALVEYIKAKIDHEFACQEVDEEGYTTSHPREREIMEAALKILKEKACRPPAEKLM
jgi:hypothetical protein